MPCGFESDRGTSTVCGSEPSAKHDVTRPLDSEHLKLLQSTREKTCRSPGVRDFACTQGDVRLSVPTHGPAGTESAQAHHRCRDTTSHTSCASHEVLYGPIPLVDNSFGPHTTPRFAKGPHPIPFLFYSQRAISFPALSVRPISTEQG